MSGIRRSRLAGSARHSAAQILTFAHGSGPSLTIMAGAWQNTLNDFSLLVYPGGSLTISDGGNIFLHGAVSGVGDNSLLRLNQTAGQFIEESRNF
jgi:hypothetical protein